ncbi:cAMP-regulated phosphoprotein 19 [Sitodiplosis mosellana]|uniref:cAMP-regulated phosphoprotein 19 n=1 Tax=Sitodiplosis mosellana TaxID=263140 RepID=UPI002444AB27|nr:cAMP-regulated phosphoprotein 19 [Sitodiplosis mosellana]
MSANQSEESSSFAAPEPVPNAAEIEKMEEEKLKAKYSTGGGVGGPGIGRPGGHSAFLQKRLLQKGKGQKYFDSGDYQMAKQKGGGTKSLFANKPIGEAIPTPETVPARKTSIIQQPCNKFQTSS